MKPMLCLAVSCTLAGGAAPVLAQMSGPTGNAGAYEWHMANVRANGIFECPARFTYLVVQQLSMNDQGAVRYEVRGEGGERKGLLHPTDPQPQEQRIAAALRGAANQPLQQPIAIMCVRAQAEDPWFTFGTDKPYTWKQASPGERPCGDGKDGMQHPLVIQLLTRESNGLLRYAVRGVIQGTSGMMDPQQPSHSQIRFSKLLIAHADKEIPAEGIALCVNAHEDDPLVDGG